MNTCQSNQSTSVALTSAAAKAIELLLTKNISIASPISDQKRWQHYLVKAANNYFKSNRKECKRLLQRHVLLTIQTTPEPHDCPFPGKMGQVWMDFYSDWLETQCNTLSHVMMEKMQAMMRNT